MQNIYLIGPRACGKTTLGKLLANSLSSRFVDTDAHFLEQYGEIAEFVEGNDWDAFRDAESEILKQISQEDSQVVGCGGGIILRKENRAILKKGFCVYLKTDPEILVGRLTNDPNECQRPSLTGSGLIEELAQILRERDPIYTQCADAVIEAATPEVAVALIRTALEDAPR